MTEPAPQYTTNGRMQSYYLTPAEETYIKRLRQMQAAANRNNRPVCLTVFISGRTVSFFDGNPSGKEKGE